MCGAYKAPEIQLSIEELREIIADAINSDKWNEDYALAMQTKEGLVRRTDSVLVGTAEGMRLMRWGFTQHGMEPLPHARSESILEKPMFCKPARETRCLIPALIYYEKAYQFWPSYADKENAPFFLAGVYRTVFGKATPEFVVVTRDAAPHISHIHDRMPVILPRQAAKEWLRPSADVLGVLAQATLDVCFEPKPQKPQAKQNEQLSMFS